MTDPQQRSHVVVVTAPDGHRYLSSTSLLTEREAEGEAASWRHTKPPAAGEPWQADVCQVLTPAELEEAVRDEALKIAAEWKVA